MRSLYYKEQEKYQILLRKEIRRKAKLEYERNMKELDEASAVIEEGASYGFYDGKTF